MYNLKCNNREKKLKKHDRQYADFLLRRKFGFIPVKRLDLTEKEKIIYNTKKSFVWLIDFIYIAKFCIIPIIFLIIGVISFSFVPQIIDVMKSYYDIDFNFLKKEFYNIQGINFLWFQAVVLLWAFNIWYSARTLLDISDINYYNEKWGYFFQKWLPRWLGSAVFIIIFAGYIKAGIRKIVHLEYYLDSKFFLFFVINFIELIIYLAIVLSRRKFFKNNLKISKTAYKINILEFSNWLFVLINYILFIILLTSFIASKIRLETFFGSLAIFVSGLAIWGFVPVLIIYLEKKIKIPLLLILLLLTIVKSRFNNNHAIRVLIETNTQAEENIEGIDEYFKNWIDIRKENIKNKKEYPVFLVAVEGGGIRSGYWTGLLLGELQDNIKKFNEHIFIISSVSGGSLGSAVYTGLVKMHLEKNSFNFKDKADKILDNDFLSPIAGALLYPDLFQRFLFIPIPEFDRSHYLEISWENAWKENFNNNIFAESYTNLWKFNNKNQKYFLPLLLLNSTKIEKGNRVIISPVLLNNSICDAVDFNSQLNYLNRVRISTAVLMSARFPYITPAGRIKWDPDKFQFKSNIWGHVADGGYFENSGAATLFDILTLLDKFNKEEIKNKKIKFYVMIIRNEPIDKKKIEEDEPSMWIYETKQPIETLLNTRSARSPYSIDTIKKYFQEKGENDRVIELNMSIGYDKVPLGWYLSESAQHSVKKEIKRILFKERKLKDLKNIIEK